MSSIYEQFAELGVIPVIKVDDPDQAEPLAKALCEGGLPAAEVTFRTDSAAETIARMVKACPDMLVGAGTVLNRDQVDAAVAAGAQFIVSPGLNPDTVSWCIEKGVPILPGTCTPGDIERAISLGLDVVKFFPAEASGGINMIKALAAPYNKMKFMPTGGVKPSNLKDYLEQDCILACGGTWMVPDSALQAGDFEQIRKLTEEAAGIVKEIRNQK